MAETPRRTNEEEARRISRAIVSAAGLVGIVIIGAAGAVSEALTSGGDASAAGVILVITLVVFVISLGVVLSTTRS